MAQPTKYSREKNFTADVDFDGSAMNSELDKVTVTTDEIRNNLALIQRDDGKLKSGSVTLESITDGVIDEIADKVEQELTSSKVNAIVTNQINSFNVEGLVVEKLADIDSKYSLIYDDQSPSESTVYSSLKTVNLMDGYLNKSGGTMTGDITNTQLLRSNDTGTTNIYGGTTWDKGAYLFLRGQDFSNTAEAGAFFLRSSGKYNGNSASYVLRGKPNGELYWSGTSINASSATVNTNALTTGSLTVSGSFTTSSLTSSSLTLKTLGSVFSESNSTNERGLFVSSSGSYGEHKGAGLALRKTTAKDNGGGFELKATTGSVNYRLIGRNNGHLEWNGNWFETQGNHAVFNHNDNKHATYINSGNQKEDSPSIVLVGTESGFVDAGKFIIRAGANKKKLVGSPTSLTWDDNEVVTVESQQNATNWYRVYADGFCVQGGTKTVSSNGTQLTFIKSFKDNNYSIVSAGTSSSTPSIFAGNIVFYSKTKSGAKIFVGDDGSFNSGSISWIAMGFIK